MAKEVVKVKRNGSTLEGLCEGATLVFKDRAEIINKITSDRSLYTLRSIILPPSPPNFDVRQVDLQQIRYPLVDEEHKLYPRSVGEVCKTHSIYPIPLEF